MFLHYLFLAIDDKRFCESEIKEVRFTMQSGIAMNHYILIGLQIDPGHIKVTFSRLNCLFTARN